MYNILIVTGAIEEKLVPAIDSTILQLKKGFLGIRSQDNLKKIRGLPKSSNQVEGLIFAREYGFCAKVRIKTTVNKKPIPSGSEDFFRTESRKGWLGVTEQEYLYPSGQIKHPQKLLSEILELLGSENLRAVVKEGMIIIRNKNLWEKIVKKAESTTKTKPDNSFEYGAIKNSVKKKNFEEASLGFQFLLNKKRISGKFIYFDNELYEKTREITNQIESKDIGENHNKLAICQFTAGLCAFHQLEFKNAVEYFKKTFAYNKNYPWIEDALAISLYNAESERTFKGKDRFVIELYKKIINTARSNAVVLITGEPGTGKDVVATEIHKYYDLSSSLSNKGKSESEKLFIPINMGSLGGDINLVNSEMFGHKKDAFTGATKDKKGAFEIVGEGTIFLDEIGNAPLQTQAQLLKIIETGLFYKVGGIGVEPNTNKARIVCATNKDLWEMIKEEKFLRDLLDRINIFHIKLPPLKDRGTPLKFLNTQLEGYYFDDSAEKKLKDYEWPGNFRELKAFIERVKAYNKNYIFEEDINDLLLIGEPKPEVPNAKLNYEAFSYKEFLDHMDNIKKAEVKNYIYRHYEKNNYDWDETIRNITQGSKKRFNAKANLKSTYGIDEKNLKGLCD